MAWTLVYAGRRTDSHGHPTGMCMYEVYDETGAYPNNADMSCGTDDPQCLRPRISAQPSGTTSAVGAAGLTGSVPFVFAATPPRRRA